MKSSSFLDLGVTARTVLASVFLLVGAVGAAFCGLALALGIFRRRLA